MSLSIDDIERFSRVWEQGFSYVAKKLNVILARRSLRIEAEDFGDSSANLAKLLNRFRNVLLPIRPIIFDMPPEVAPWTLGFVNGKENKLCPIGYGPITNDEELNFVIEFLDKREWDQDTWRENIVDSVMDWEKSWHQFFGELNADLENKEPPPSPPSIEDKSEWSIPMTKAEMARRITGKRRPRTREVKQFLELHGLRQISDRKFQVRLDTMDSNIRKKFE